MNESTEINKRIDQIKESERLIDIQIQELQNKKIDLETEERELRSLLSNRLLALKNERKNVTTPSGSATPRNISSESGYNDLRWKTKKEEILKRDNYLCQLCELKPAQEVHHINYYRDDGGFVGNEPWRSNNNNLVSLCSCCHQRFKGTYCEDVIFIPTRNPIRILKPTFLSKNKELENPSWEEVSPYLRKMQMWGNEDLYKNLYLVLFSPETTQLGKEILFGQTFNGLNELEKVKIKCRYNGKNSVDEFISPIQRFSEEFSSIRKNAEYIIRELEAIRNDCNKPTVGYIPIASRSKTRGYHIRLFDIAKNSIVATWDLSKSDEYINSVYKEHNVLAILYTMKYIYDKHKDLGVKVYDLPIFPNDPNGGLPLYGEFQMNDWKNRLANEGIHKLMKEIAEQIDFSEFFICTRWKTEEWGEIPTYYLRSNKKRNRQNKL